MYQPARRVHHLAKELGVDSRAIIALCRKHDVPEHVICTHMSVLAPDVEAVIRKWLDDDGSGSSEVLKPNR